MTYFSTLHSSTVQNIFSNSRGRLDIQQCRKLYQLTPQSLTIMPLSTIPTLNYSPNQHLQVIPLPGNALAQVLSILKDPNVDEVLGRHTCIMHTPIWPLLNPPLPICLVHWVK